MRFFSRALVVLAIAFSCFSLSSWALPPGTQVLSLHDAVSATLQRNPELAVHGFRLKALAGERQTAALRPELQISGELENLAGSGEFRGVDAGEFTLSLSSVIELGGQRDARLGLVTARQQQLESAQRLLTLDVLTQVTHQFIAVVAAQELLAAQQGAHQLAQENRRVLSKQVDAGRTPEAELLRASAALARADIELQHAQQQLRSERIKLGAFWADTNPAFQRAQADLFSFSVVAPLPELVTQLAANPDLALLADELQVRRAELQHAQSQRNTPVAWSAGVRRFQATDDSALVLGVSLPLGTAGRTSGAIATATAHQQSAEYQRDSAAIHLQAQLANLFEARQQALAEVNALRNDVLPLLKQAMRATSDAFNQGRYSYLELNLAQREMLDAQRALITAAARAQTLTADIHRLTGATATAPHSVLKDLP